MYFCIVLKGFDMNTTILVVTPSTFEVNPSIGYAIGAVTALFIVVYLIYTFCKSEKF